MLKSPRTRRRPITDLLASLCTMRACPARRLGTIAGQDSGSLACFGERQTECRRYARTVGRIGPGTVVDMALFHLNACIPHRTGGVLEEPLLLDRCHEAEEITWLLEVVFIDTMIP